MDFERITPLALFGLLIAFVGLLIFVAVVTLAPYQRQEQNPNSGQGESQNGVPESPIGGPGASNPSEIQPVNNQEQAGGYLQNFQRWLGYVVYSWLPTDTGANWVLVFVAIGAAILTLLGIGILQRQTQSTEQAALAAESSARTEAAALAVVERPYVYLSEVRILNQAFAAGDKIVVNTVFGNSGRQPTIDLEVTTNLIYLKADGGAVLIESGQVTGGLHHNFLTVAPNATLDIPVARGELIGEIDTDGGGGDPRYDGNWRIVVYGQISYSRTLAADPFVVNYAASLVAWERETFPDGANLWRIHHYDSTEDNQLLR